MILFQHHLIEIEYDNIHQLLQVRWTNPLSPEAYRRVLKKIAEIIAAYQVKSILLETFNSPGNDQKNELWTSKFFLDMYKQTGLQKIARVTLDHVSENLLINRWLSQEENAEVEFRQFKYQFEAFDWLLEQDDKYLLRYGT